MNETPLEDVVRNVDRRLTAVEQILPTLATRDDLHAAIAPLATREELRAAIGSLATREELQAEGERSRHYARMLYEDLRDDHRIILEHLIALSARVDALARR